MLYLEEMACGKFMEPVWLQVTAKIILKIEVRQVPPELVTACLSLDSRVHGLPDGNLQKVIELAVHKTMKYKAFLGVIQSTAKPYVQQAIAIAIAVGNQHEEKMEARGGASSKDVLKLRSREMYCQLTCCWHDNSHHRSIDIP